MQGPLQFLNTAAHLEEISLAMMLVGPTVKGESALGLLLLGHLEDVPSMSM